MMRRLFCWRRGASPAPVSLTLYTRAGCHLCDVMKDEIGRARLDRPHELREVDVDRDPELVRRFDRSLPVLEIAGRIAFKGRLTAGELERKFARLARGSGNAGRER